MYRKLIKPSVLFIALSLLIHLGFWAGVYQINANSDQRPERIEVSFVNPDQLDAKKAPKQIVDQKHQINNEIDKNAKYLSAFNQKVLHETRADQAGQFRNTPAGGSNPHAKTEGKQAGRRPRHHLRKGELPALKDLSPKFAPNEGEALQALTAHRRGAQTDDYLKNVNKGLQTLLSTREFVYYAYYSRIRTQIRQYWEPYVKEKVKLILKQGRNIASANDRVTRVLVTLDKNGALIKVQVLTRSGVHDLDDAAVQAFKSAAPFPNPPKGMVEKDGTIKIRWDFVLEAWNESPAAQRVS